jgi:ABC-2 type transport system ATP-binding protein
VTTTDQTIPLSVTGLTKRYGTQTVVDDLTFAIAPSRVTGFLGPNGAGKTTTLRMAVGLATPTAGATRLFGQPYETLVNPSQRVGTLIDASGFHPGRRARHELAIHAATAEIDDHRVAEVLAEVGLEAAADKRVGQLSLGMRQRLGLASALLGEPELLILDEPANGLDPAGMHWLRQLLRDYAAKGVAVLVSSHVLSELALFADDVVVINHGKLVKQAPLHQLVTDGTQRHFVQSPKPAALVRVLARLGAEVADADGGVTVAGLSAQEIGDAAASNGIPLYQLRTEESSLEDVFLDLTGDEGAIR